MESDISLVVVETFQLLPIISTYSAIMKLEV